MEWLNFSTFCYNIGLTLIFYQISTSNESNDNDRFRETTRLENGKRTFKNRRRNNV